MTYATRCFACVALSLSLAVAARGAAAPGAVAAPATAAPAIKMAPGETAIYVADMHCAGCAKKVSSRLFKVKGVMKVRCDVEADVVVVTPQSKKTLDPKAAWAAIQAAGRTPVRLVGPAGTYVADEKTRAPQKVAEAAAAGTPSAAR